METNLTLQIHDTSQGWIDAAEIHFRSPQRVEVEYDLDYAATYLGQNDLFALSVTTPVGLEPYVGEVPGFLVDLVPQGHVLKRLMLRHDIKQDNDYRGILSQIPLAPPGNQRIKEPWFEIERDRPAYTHKGFERSEIITANMDFLEYMEAHGAPVGGTSGAVGGAPKFLLREDFSGRYHADGYLDDRFTKQAWLIKFPFTDSNNSKLILKTEAAYYKILTKLGLDTIEAPQWDNDILFIPRFDRVRIEKEKLHYFGLESFYSANGINTHGGELSHEQNIELIKTYSTDAKADVLEYFKRDLCNQMLANTDNHGRNTSFIKRENGIKLSPVYDVTAMQFFEGDFILPLTRWLPEHFEIGAQKKYVAESLVMSQKEFDQEFSEFKELAMHTEELMRTERVDEKIIERSSAKRNMLLKSI